MKFYFETLSSEAISEHEIFILKLTKNGKPKKKKNPNEMNGWMHKISNWIKGYKILNL